MRRILIIDDDDVMREAAAASLSTVGGYRVLSTGDPEEGLRLARAEAPDGVLLDVSMPGMEGPEVLAALKGDPETRDIPVVFFTGDARSVAADRWRGSGASGAVAKPFDFPLLPDQFARLVGWADGPEAPAPTTNGEHLLELINDILDLSKIEVGKMEAEMERFSLSQLVEATLDQLRGAIRGKDIIVQAVLPDSMAPITTDPGKLKQIMINLVGNAIKFTEEGEITVQVYADADTHRPERIEIRDTGVGIPQDRLDAIFGAFEQADTGTARRFGGTGLGLTIVSSLADLLGFRIEVESEPGVGSTFRVLLPTDGAEPLGKEIITQPAKPADRFTPRMATGETELAGRMVLVIDDDTDSRILLTHHLEESGARTITASSGDQGIRMAREFRPDIITLDLLLPGMTGWEILRALKSDPDLRDIPVVVVSVIAGEDRGSVLGAADVIEKPLDRHDLIDALQRTLSEQPRRILIVDDTPDARDILCRYLEDEGAEIRTASDGIEALRMLESYTPDLVLLDLLMPNMDGIAVIKKLNEREPYRSIPIIVVTAKDLTPEEEETLSKSALAVLRKGARLEEGLRAALQGVL